MAPRNTISSTNGANAQPVSRESAEFVMESCVSLSTSSSPNAFIIGLSIKTRHRAATAAKAHVVPMFPVLTVSIRRTSGRLMKYARMLAKARNSPTSSTHGASSKGSEGTPAMYAYSMRPEKNSAHAPKYKARNMTKYSNAFFM